MDNEPECKSVEDVEITPKMIEAGAEVIWRHLSDVFAYDSAEARWLAEEIFRAMADVDRS